MKILGLSGEDILAMQHVTRWHMVRMRRNQSLAEHVGTVALFATKIAYLWATASGNLDREQMAKFLTEVLDEALTHDAHEVEFGDMPAIMKSCLPPGTEDTMERQFWGRRIPVRLDAHPDVRTVVDLADKLEAVLHYTLEGRDRSLQMQLEFTLHKKLVNMPPAVEQWVRKLVRRVADGRFTPQPLKRRAESAG